MDGSPPTLLDDAGLRIGVPVRTKLWGIERWERGMWTRCRWREAGDEAHAKATGHFPLDCLALSTIRTRWGEGLYRLVYSMGPGRARKGTSSPFRVELVDDDAAEARDEDDSDAPALPPPNPQAYAPPAAPKRPANGNGHSNGNGHALAGLPTSTKGAPPLFASPYGDFVRHRDGSALESVGAILALLTQLQVANEERMQAWRKAESEREDRRSREFLSMMALREKTIEADASIRIEHARAAANMGTASSAQLAESLRSEVEHLRTLASEAQQAAGSAQNEQLAAILSEISASLDQLGQDDDEDAPPQNWGPAVAAIADHLLAPVAQAVAQRIGAGAMPAQIADAVDAAVKGGGD